MSTKTELQAFINTIGTGEPNTALEIRTLLNNLLNDNYPTPVLETQASGVITDNTGHTDFTYSLRFTKQGRICSIIGTITNTTDNVLGEGAIIFDFKDTQYKADDTFTQYLDTNVSIVTGANTSLVISGAIGPNKTLSINQRYIVKD